MIIFHKDKFVTILFFNPILKIIFAEITKF